MELFAHLSGRGQPTAVRMPPPGFDAPVLNAWAIESTYTGQQADVPRDHATSYRRVYSMQQMVHLRKHPASSAEHGRQMGVIEDLSMCYSKDVEAFWDARLAADGCFLWHSRDDAEGSPLLALSSAGKQPGAYNFSFGASYSRDSRLDQIGNQSFSDVPELVPLDESWLKPHPLLDGALEDALEPDGLQADAGDSLIHTESQSQPVRRRERGEAFVRPGFESKVQALDARRSSPPPSHDRRASPQPAFDRRMSPQPATDRRASPMNFGEEAAKGETVRYAKGPSASGGFALRAIRRQQIARQRNATQKLENSYSMEGAWVPSYASPADNNNIDNSPAQSQSGADSGQAEFDEFWNGADGQRGELRYYEKIGASLGRSRAPAENLSFADHNNVHAVTGERSVGKNGCEVATAQNVPQAVSADKRGASEPESRAFGQWFNIKSNFEPDPVPNHSAFVGRTPECDTQNGGENDLAPNVLSFFNAVKAQAASAGPRDDKRPRNTETRAHSVRNTSKLHDLSADALSEAEHWQNSNTNAEHESSRHGFPLATVLTDVPATQSGLPSSGDLNPVEEQGPQRFSAEQFFGMFTGGAAKSLNVGTMHGVDQYASPEHLMRGLNLAPHGQPMPSSHGGGDRSDLKSDGSGRRSEPFGAILFGMRPQNDSGPLPPFNAPLAYETTRFDHRAIEMEERAEPPPGLRVPMPSLDRDGPFFLLHDARMHSLPLPHAHEGGPYPGHIPGVGMAGDVHRSTHPSGLPYPGALQRDHGNGGFAHPPGTQLLHHAPPSHAGSFAAAPGGAVGGPPPYTPWLPHGSPPPYAPSAHVFPPGDAHPPYHAQSGAHAEQHPIFSPR
eukprot:CAMPEP_0185830136 /NCGR_PEP_ID=MMETSP1353-20130828/647_1 /TAXON_ID=1077150 /ORGANISM="Erythrolobus australicus, Strain CCMP3124" /LENGTH=844 /DNA_ID=CAMNT_0028527997 /DNA_START=254 /DNA_END=2788 /DNA_ORIENTATION=-